MAGCVGREELSGIVCAAMQRPRASLIAGAAARVRKKIASARQTYAAGRPARDATTGNSTDQQAWPLVFFYKCGCGIFRSGRRNGGNRLARLPNSGEVRPDE